MANKTQTFALITAVVIAAAVLMAFVIRKAAQRTTYKAKIIAPIPVRKRGIYEKYIKRIIDVICAIGAIVVFSPLYLCVAVLVRLKLGSPVLFTQYRPGLVSTDGRETVFKMYKFRTMTDERDERGELLPDNKRLTKFGAWLRATSLDEIPEALNILNGTMSVIGPRPQLVQDMVFMTRGQRQRHTAKPGLSGLAQIHGRNAISWEEKLNWDLKYIKKISFVEDAKIMISTIKKAFIDQDDITQQDMSTAENYGEHLLTAGKISEEEYEVKQAVAENILNNSDGIERERGLVSIVMPSYNTAQYIKDAVRSVLNQTYTNWELLIVDDCSSDDTDEVVLSFNDPRIKLFHNEHHSGAAVSRNKALRKAKGQWIAFLDSDDLWLPEKLEKQIKFMNDHGYVFSYTNYEEIDVEGKRTGVQITGPKKITQIGMYNYCWPGCLTVMFDAGKVGLIQIADIKKNNDYAIWLEVCEEADCYLLEECLGQYRKGRSGSVSTHSIKSKIKWHYKLYKDAEGMGNIESFVNTQRNLVFGLYKKRRYVKR